MPIGQHTTTEQGPSGVSSGPRTCFLLRYIRNRFRLRKTSGTRRGAHYHCKGICMSTWNEVQWVDDVPMESRSPSPERSPPRSNRQLASMDRDVSMQSAFSSSERSPPLFSHRLADMNRDVSMQSASPERESAPVYDLPQVNAGRTLSGHGLPVAYAEAAAVLPHESFAGTNDCGPRSMAGTLGVRPSDLFVR
jgi:hypothetical protein